MATKKATKKTAPKKSAPKTTAKSSTKKTTKKSAPKTTVKSTAVVAAKAETEKTQKAPATKQKGKFRRPYIVLVFVIVLLAAALYYFRGLFVAAVVNGQPISRLAVIQQAEKQSGKQTLDTLVRDALIEQEAKKENVTVSDKEVNTEISTLQNNLKKQHQDLTTVLAAQGMTEDDLRKLIRLDKLVQKMVGKNIKVTDKEVNNYIAKNKDSLPSTNEAALKKQVKAQLTQQKTNEAVQSWLANLQQKANIVYFVQY